MMPHQLRHPSSPSCDRCHGAGWRPSAEDPRRFERCGCRRSTAPSAPIRLTGKAEIDALVTFLRTHACGEANAITRAEIQRRFPEVARQLHVSLAGLDRKLRRVAHEANELFIPVCASDRGYFYAERPSDFDPLIGRIGSQIRLEEARLARLRAMRERMANQD